MNKRTCSCFELTLYGAKSSRRQTPRPRRAWQRWQSLHCVVSAVTARTAAEGGRADPIIHCGICLANSRRASTRRRGGKGEPGGEVNGTNYRGPCRTGAMGGWRQTQHNSATQQRIISHSDHLRPPQFSRARRGAGGSELLFRRIRGRGPRAGAAVI